MAFICLCVFGKLTKSRNRVMHWSLGGLRGVATASCSLEVWGTWNFQPICLPPWCPLRWWCRWKLLNKFCVCSENFSESRRALHAFFLSFILSSVSFLFAFQKKSSIHFVEHLVTSLRTGMIFLRNTFSSSFHLCIYIDCMAQLNIKVSLSESDFNSSFRDIIKPEAFLTCPVQIDKYHDCLFLSDFSK